MHVIRATCYFGSSKHELISNNITLEGLGIFRKTENCFIHG
jgi:hypothetical protein